MLTKLLTALVAVASLQSFALAQQKFCTQSAPTFGKQANRGNKINLYFCVFTFL